MLPLTPQRASKVLHDVVPTCLFNTVARHFLTTFCPSLDWKACFIPSSGPHHPASCRSLQHGPAEDTDRGKSVDPSSDWTICESLHITEGCISSNEYRLTHNPQLWSCEWSHYSKIHKPAVETVYELCVVLHIYYGIIVIERTRQLKLGFQLKLMFWKMVLENLF